MATDFHITEFGRYSRVVRACTRVIPSGEKNEVRRKMRFEYKIMHDWNIQGFFVRKERTEQIFMKIPRLTRRVMANRMTKKIHQSLPEKEGGGVNDMSGRGAYHSRQSRLRGFSHSEKAEPTDGHTLL